MRFVPGRELSRLLYLEHIAPIMESTYPDLLYGAASYGMCSESLGLDDEVSMDHMWGPRVTIFLSEMDHEKLSKEIQSTFRELLPDEFKGFKTTWMKPGVDVISTKEKILYSVWTTTVNSALGFCGGIDALPLQYADWLKVSEQHLLEFTNGVVFRDDLGELANARELLHYYPNDVLKFLLTCEWNAVGGDMYPIGRIGSRGDRLGLHVQAGKIVHHLMRIAFMVHRKYMPYKKWFGTLFNKLPVAHILEPIMMDILHEAHWQKIEEKICEASEILLKLQNNLGLAPKIALNAQIVDDERHHMNVDFWSIGRKLSANLQPPLKTILDNQVFWLHERSLILWNGEVGKWSMLLQK
ncbi:MAG: DUF4037 domain-containing protein [Anaerolineae bacterium]|nr:DUF4037 domain-containing protein [Anaerolineae bacterium]